MDNLALYRRYRPDTFDKVIGQDAIVKTLKNQIETGRIGHAYLFTGTRGTGKTTMAKIFAKAINCSNPKGGSPCNECDVCKYLEGASNVDVLEIDAASNNGVNEIRDLRENIQYPPVVGKYKVYIIDEVHMLTGPAFNALLKTLEEPPKHAVFILATTEVHKIPATILSRCMRFDFRLVETEKIANLISEIYDEIGKPYEKEAVNLIAQSGEGSVRDALSIADTALSFSPAKLTYNDVTEVLGSFNHKILEDFVSAILDGNAGKILSEIDKMTSIGKSIGVMIKDVLRYVRNLLIVKTCEDANAILKLPEDEFNTMQNMVKDVAPDRLLRILEIYVGSETSVRYSVNPKVIFETASVKASRPDSDYDLTALLSRVESLENALKNGNFVAPKNTAEEKPEPIDTENKKEEPKELPIDLYSLDRIKSDMIFGVRNSGNDMLASILSGVKLFKSGNVLSIYSDTEADEKILNSENYKKVIENALSFLQPFALKIVYEKKESESEKFNQATQQIKQLFGDDIVIIRK